MTTEEIASFNKRCAEALGWEFNNFGAFQIPFEVQIFCVSLRHNILIPGNMLFHMSYDWAMLLVKRCSDNVRNHNALGRKFTDQWALLESNPYELSKAALTVLEGNNDE